MKDQRDPEQVGNALAAMRAQMPDLKFSEIADLFERIGNAEAGSASLANERGYATPASSNGVGPRGEGVVESDNS